MKPINLKFQRGFAIVGGNKRSQAASMVIPPGGQEGGPANNHHGADQWLFVVSGKGSAIIGGKKFALQTSALVLIERGRNHEIRNTGTTDLVTLNVYVPPAYTKLGNERPAAKSI